MRAGIGGEGKMDALDWLRESSKEPIRPVYAVFGDDSYLIRESIAAVARVVLPDEDRDAGISRFAGPTTPLATVLDEVCTLPFFSRRRLVVVDEADPFVTKYRKDLEAYVGNPSSSGIAVAPGEAVAGDHEAGPARRKVGTGDQRVRPARDRARRRG